MRVSVGLQIGIGEMMQGILMAGGNVNRIRE
jgi:hypothetical protein